MKNSADANTAKHAVAAHTLNICAAARKAGLAITPARSIDVFRTISHVDMTSKDDYGLALRINLASTKEEGSVMLPFF